MKKIVLTLALAATTLCSYAQKSGIIAGFSYGKLGKHTQAAPWNTGDPAGLQAVSGIQPTIGFNLGYQFKFDLNDRFYISTAILGKVQHYDIYYAQYDEGVSYSHGSQHDWVWGLSANGLINYKIWKGLNCGIGIEPTEYFKTNKLMCNIYSNVFDFPIVGNLGYEFNNGMEISASYKHGFKDMYREMGYHSCSKNRDFVISLYIPIISNN